jgi:protein TonB
VVSEQVEAKAEKKLITQKKTEKKTVATVKPEAAHQQHPQLSAEMLQQQITQLGTEIKLSQQNTEQTKIEFVDSVSAAHKYVAAQYEMDWTNKVENVGNKVFPEEAKNFSGTLTMDVGIKKDGSIYSIRINQSSGNPALDNWAKKIVRNNAPYALLPSELLQELDVLVITRVWKFSDESGMSSR